jgi:hypothetical protein
MNPLTKWNPFRELDDIQKRLSFPAKEARILFLLTYQHGYRAAKQFAKNHKKILHIIVAAFAIATAITQCGEQYKSKEPTPVELWF